MFAVGGVFALIQAIGMVFLPPSPRYFVLRGKEQQVLQAPEYCICMHTTFTNESCVWLMPVSARRHVILA